MMLTFTGTQRGMTAFQLEQVYHRLKTWSPNLVAIHHGGCTGADTEFHEACYELSLLKLVHVWPSNLPKKQGRLVGSGFKVNSPSDPLFRNKAMVERSGIVLATPGEHYELLRSGTWATIRYAKELGMAVDVIFPMPPTNQ